MTKLTTTEMECAVARWFNIRQNLIVPRVSWGFGIHECDLLVVTKSGYVYEVEIKVTKADLVKDIKKKHQHNSKYIKYLYFAIPEYLKDCIDKIPERAGVLVVNRKPKVKGYCTNPLISVVSFRPLSVTLIRRPQVLSKYRLSNEERYQVARLGALRIWSLTEKLLETRKQKS